MTKRFSRTEKDIIWILSIFGGTAVGFVILTIVASSIGYPSGS